MGLGVSSLGRAFPGPPGKEIVNAGLGGQAALAAALASAPGPITPAQIAAGWRKDKRNEAKVTAILDGFVRTAFASTGDGGKTFRARRAA